MFSTTHGKSGDPSSSSHHMHPDAHISMDCVYVVAPNRSSGGRYQREATVGVNAWIPVEYGLDKPKSASFNDPSLYKRLLSFS
jgi:hypothetical protein